MICPSCHGRKTSFLLIDGDMLHETREVPCQRCNGTGTEQLGGWTIYDHPKDHPHGFIARRWIAVAAEVIATDETLVADTLEALREKLPPDLIRISRSPQDEPVIVEVWL